MDSIFGRQMSSDILTHKGLDALFIPAPRSGVLSAWYGHVPFAYWIINALRPRRLVELGTHNGVSYAAFCDAVSRAGLDTQCFAIDTWQGDDHAGHYGEDVYTDLRTFHDPRYAAFSELVRSTFDQALDYFQDGSIDLLHIDGCHSYEAVRHDFDHWRSKLSPTAVVLFHDTNVRERHFGVWRLWAELQLDHPSFEFMHEHGLGVLAFGSEVPDAVLELCNLSSSRDIATIRNRFAFSGRSCIIEAELDRLRADAAAEKNGFNAALTECDGQIASLSQAMAERDGQITRLKQAMTERDGQITNLKQAMTERDGQIASLNQAMTGRDGHITRLKQAMTERDGQITSLKQAMTERDGQIASLKQAMTERDGQIAALETSTTWLMTMPMRAVASRAPKPLLRTGRRALKAAWWAMTPLRIPARLRARRDLLAGGVVAQRQVDRFSLDNIPPLQGDLLAGGVVAQRQVDRFSLDNIPPLQGDETAAAAWYDPVTPEVSIVVLNWNRGDMTLLCLQHLWQRTTGHRYEIIVVDNGSQPEDVAFLRNNAARARIISLGVNRYFGEANNIGVEAARGRYVCLLNNDAFVHANWLEPLVSFLDADPYTGAVGPRFLYPDGRLQEAGALIGADGSAVQLGKGEAADDPQFASVRQVDYISAACVLMRRKEFLHVLGFDLAWDPAYYEDVDLCLKLSLIGLRTFYCPESTVTHIENATSSDTRNKLNLNNIITINKAKFVARWEAFLRTAGTTKPSLVPPLSPAVVTGTGKPRIVIFTPYNITPGGGERYFFTIAEAFRDVAEVTLVTPKPFSRTRILTMGRELGLRLDHIVQVCMDEIYIHPPFDLSFIVGNEIYPPMGRMATHNIFICQFPFPIQDDSYARRVRPFWDQYDILLTYSPFVRRHVTRMADSLALPAQPIEVLSPPVPLLPVGLKKRTQMILHVGRFFAGGHCKRQDVLIEALRTLVEMGVEAELHLAGSIHPEAEHRDYYARLVESASGLPVHFHANCSGEKLKGLYTESGIYWHATGFGHDAEREPHTTEHFGISVVEAMSAGCIPVVFAAGGPAEVVEDGITGFHFRTIDEICSITKKLIEDTKSEDMAALVNAAAKAARSYDETAFKDHVRRLAARFISFSDHA